MAEWICCQNCGAARDPEEKQCPRCGMTHQKDKQVAGRREMRRRAPKDNIDLDMRDAKRLGYGVQYGRFKADHPHTKAANESRLEKKPKPAAERPVYEIICRGCGNKFLAKNKKRLYCSDECKDKKNGADYRATHKKEV